MRVKILLNLGNEWEQPFREDEEVEVDEKLGNRLLAARLAVIVPTEPESPDPEPDKFEEVRRQPGHAKRSKTTDS